MGPFKQDEYPPVVDMPGWSWTTDAQGNKWYCPPATTASASSGSTSGGQAGGTATATSPNIVQAFLATGGQASSTGQYTYTPGAGMPSLMASLGQQCIGPFGDIKQTVGVPTQSGWTWIKDNQGLLWYCPPGQMPPSITSPPPSAPPPSPSSSPPSSPPSCPTNIQTYTIVQTPPQPYYIALQGTPGSWSANGYQLPDGWSVLETVTDTPQAVANIVSTLATKAVLSTIPGQESLPPELAAGTYTS